MKLSKEFKIGVFVLVAIALLVVGYKYLEGINLFKKNREYVVFYNSAEGLTPSNPVIYKGVQVGLVKAINFDGNRQDSVRVTIMIDHPEFEMRKFTTAKLSSDGFLGGKRIDLIYLPKDTIGNRDTIIAKIGDTLRADVEQDLADAINEQVAPLKKKAEDLIGTIDSVVTTITAFWDESTASNLSESVAGVRRAILQFEQTAIRLDTLVASERMRLSRIFRNVESITQNLSDNNDNITAALGNINTFSDELKDVKLQATISRAEEAFTKLNLIISKINSGEGTLGNLIYNDSLHSAILETNAYVQLLVEDLRHYPNRYLHFSIFGSREKTPKLNSKEEKLLKELLDLKKDGQLRRFTQEEMDSLRQNVFK